MPYIAMIVYSCKRYTAAEVRRRNTTTTDNLHDLNVSSYTSMVCEHNTTSLVFKHAQITQFLLVLQKTIITHDTGTLLN